MRRVIVAPTITAFDSHQYRFQMEQITPFAKRVHIDLMDGEFAPTRSPSPDHVWWPHTLKADVHLMYQHPAKCLNQLILLKPHMVVIHIEAKVDHMNFASILHKEGIKSGLALLSKTPVKKIERQIHSFDHILVFDGKLGYHGGRADMKITSKIAEIRELDSDVEIGWDGGINDNNANKLKQAGVDVLNVGSFIQKAGEPDKAYAKLEKATKG